MPTSCPHTHTHKRTHIHTQKFLDIMKAYKKKLNKEIDFELKAKTFANKNKKASKQKASSNKEVRIKAGGS